MAAKFTSKTKWRAKLEKVQPHRLVSLSAAAKNSRAGSLLIPRPIDVDRVIARVRKGKLITAALIRQCLTAEFNAMDSKVRRAACDNAAGDSDYTADSACPLCTGIFVRIAAEAAEEDRRAGRKRITPYWRVIRDDGSLNEKFPGGPAAQAAKLRRERHRIESQRTRKLPRVVDFEKKLVKLAQITVAC